jgi:ribosomal protein L17
MADMQNTAEKHSSENIIQALMDTARTMTVNANDLKKTVETIITSCHTHGTKGEAQKSFLLRKADGMKILAELYMSIAKRYKSAAMKLAEGTSEDKVLHALNSYNVFISDQIKSEQECYEQILNMLRV